MPFRAPGKKTVTPHGTAQQLFNGLDANNNPLLLRGRELTIQALTSNTGNVYVGDRNLVVATGAGQRSKLAAGQPDTIASPGSGLRINPEEVFIDTDVDGEGVTWSLA